MKLNVSMEETKTEKCRRFPGCTVIGHPTQVCATLTALVMQAAVGPWGVGAMQFSGINRVIVPYEIPDGTILDNRAILDTCEVSVVAKLKPNLGWYSEPWANETPLCNAGIYRGSVKSFFPYAIIRFQLSCTASPCFETITFSLFQRGCWVTNYLCLHIKSDSHIDTLVSV